MRTAQERIIRLFLENRRRREYFVVAQFFRRKRLIRISVADRRFHYIRKQSDQVVGEIARIARNEQLAYRVFVSYALRVVGEFFCKYGFFKE